MAETSFQNLSDGILREIFQAYCFTDEWSEIRNEILETIIRFHKSQNYDTLSEQVFFSIVGSGIRELLGYEEKFEPATIREPYLLKVEREHLQQSLYHQINTQVTSIVIARQNGGVLMSDKVYQLQSLVVNVLEFHREHGKEDKFLFLEIIGAMLLRTMSKSQFRIVRDALSDDRYSAPRKPLEPNTKLSRNAIITRPDDAKIDNDSLLNSYYSVQDSMSQVYSLGLRTKDDYLKLFRHLAGTSDEVSDILERYTPSTMDSICDRILGSFLSNSMRTAIWSYRFLQRKSELSLDANHYTAELHRLGVIKNIDLGSYNSQTPISNTIQHYIQKCIARAFPMWLKENQDSTNNKNNISSNKGGSKRSIGSNILSDTSSTVLARRATHLVNAIYVLTGLKTAVRILQLFLLLSEVCPLHLGTISERGVMMAVLLLRVFHDESPVSEKVLRMYAKMVEDCIPSEHPNAKYSMINTNNMIWHLVKNEDPELFNHLKIYIVKDDDEGDLDESALPPVLWNNGFGGIFRQAKKELPFGFPLIRGWLDTGFLGWLPEFGVIFIWDQISLLGSTPSLNHRFIVRLCVQLLKRMRNALLSCTEKFPATIRAEGRRLRSKELFNITCESLIMYNDDAPLEEREEFENARAKAAAICIQRTCRGYIVRLRGRMKKREGKGASFDSEQHHYGAHWAMKLSIQSDRSQAYQLLEMQRYNRANPDRKPLKMTNSRSECMIDVYGRPDEDYGVKSVKRDYQPPEIAPTSRQRHRVSIEQSPKLKDITETDENDKGIVKSIASKESMDLASPSINNPIYSDAVIEGTAEAQVVANLPSVAENEENTIAKDTSMHVEKAPASLFIDEHSIPVEGDIASDSQNDGLEYAISGKDEQNSDSMDADLVQYNQSTSNIESLEVLNPEATIPAIFGTNEEDISLKNITDAALSEHVPPVQNQDSAVSLDFGTESSDRIFSESFEKVSDEDLGRGDLVTSLRVPDNPENEESPERNEDISEPVTSSAPLQLYPVSHPEHDAVARALIANTFSIEVVENNSSVAVVSEQPTSNTAHKDNGAALGHSNNAIYKNHEGISPAIRTFSNQTPERSHENSFTHHAIQPELQKEIDRLGLSTIVIPSDPYDSDDSVEKIVHANAEDSLDYVSLGSIAKMNIAPSIRDEDNTDIEERYVGEQLSLHPNAAELHRNVFNPAPALYGFFLDEREDIREEYRVLEEISKAIADRKHEFERSEKRKPTHQEREHLLSDLSNHFLETKKRIEEKGSALRQKELRLLSKWQSTHKN